MGSHFMSEYGKGTSAKDVYDRLWQDARDEYGSDAYNGSLSTSSGCFEWDSLGPRHIKDAYRLTESICSDDDDSSQRLEKWGSFGYVPVAPSEDFDVKKKTFTLNLLGKVGKDHWEHSHIREAVDQMAPAGWRAGDYKVTATEQEYGTRRKPGAGSRHTKFVVTPYNKEFDTLDAAEQYAAETVAQKLAQTAQYPQHSRPFAAEIKGIITKDDGASLVTYETYRKKWKVTIEAEYYKAKGPLHTEGFLFFGWAAT